MGYDERQVTTRTEQTTGYGAPPPVAPGSVPPGPLPPTYGTGVADHRTAVVSERHVQVGPGRTLRRLVIFLFGLIQLLIVLRLVLLLLDAREGNALVAGILDVSQIFVGPFEGILRTNALQSGGAVFDVAAIVALVGWTILEVVILALLRIFDREP